MNNENQKRIVRKPELLGKVGLSDATVARLEKAGRFPQRIQLGENSVGWFSDEVSKWMESRAEARPIGDGVKK